MANEEHSQPESAEVPVFAAASATQWRLQALMSAVEAMVIEFDDVCCVRSLSDAVAVRLGCTSDALIGRPIDDLVGSGRADLLSALQTGAPRAHLELELWDRAGSPVTLKASLTPVLSPEGRPCGAFLVGHELTPRAAAESPWRERARRSEALEEAQRLARLGSWEIQHPEQVVECSREMLHLFRLPLGLHRVPITAIYERIHPDDRGRAEEVSNAAVAGRVPFEFEFRALLPDGEQRIYRAVGKATYEEDGGVRRVSGTTQDITEYRRIERLQGEFVTMVGHELRTPLTTMRGTLYLLRSGAVPLDSAQARTMLEMADRNTTRMVELVNDLLDLQRLESGRLTLHRAPVDVGAIVEQTRELMAPLAAEAGVSLDITADSATVEADATRIVQVLTHLIDNAVNHSPDGAVVHVSIRNGGGELVFEVRDHGPGIPESQLNAIFERFRQFESQAARRRGGTGLGLAIARGIVEQHGGRIWASSRLGEGATFTFTLPL